MPTQAVKPANYDRLTSTQKAIYQDHVHAGVTPPRMEPPSAAQLAPSRYPLTYDIIDD